MAKVKLTDSQYQALKHAIDGWVIHHSAIGNGTWQKKPDSMDAREIHAGTYGNLISRGLIATKEAGFPTSTYKVTDLGRAAAEAHSA